MAVSGSWQDSARSMWRMTYAGAWTPEEYAVCFADSTREIEAEPHPVDLILDMSAAERPPLRVFENSRQTAYDHARNLRSVVVVTHDQMTLNAVRIGTRAFTSTDIPVQIAGSLGEAVLLLRAMRQGVNLAR